ncbi:hypothetical protein PABG_02736 [Paracoccidioides brasiliensis Pb03]|nr:hypothetical protein PABG_02736 [Paracoccidioides brasiliensis Pb03]
MTTAAPPRTEPNPISCACKLENSSLKLAEWPQLVGLAELDQRADQLEPLHWLVHPCPAELKVTPETLCPDVATIVNQSLSIDLYKPSAPPSTDGASDVGLSGDRKSVVSVSQSRPQNGSTSQLPRLSSVNNSDGTRSPSKFSLDSATIKRPLGWITGKTPNPSKGLRDKLRERNTFKECSSCLDDILDKNLLGLTCQHKYCLKCFLQLITTAMKTERLFPPKCCLEEIPSKMVLDNLGSSLREAYKLKTQEFATPERDRWYCPSSTCGRWIPLSKFKKSLKSVQKTCPYCRVKVCSLCRGLAHNNLDDCPQDHGLEATLEEAENHGWKRCYNCHSMVELTAGCRHITCKCGSEFCYTCGARWHTCACTEDDQRRRQNEIEARRQERNQAAEIEAAELAAALAEIERLERQEALERERLEKEQRQREEMEARDKEMKRMMYISERVRGLRTALSALNKSQQCRLNERHEKAAFDLLGKTRADTSEFEQQREKLMNGLRLNQKQRKDQLLVSQTAELESMTLRHEEEEDETFVTISRYLKGKPNRESREKSIIDKLKISQGNERQSIEKNHQAAKLELEQMNDLEAKALEEGLKPNNHSTQEEKLEMVFKLSLMIIADRCWFSSVVKTRWRMLEQYRYRMIDTGADIEELPAIEIVPKYFELSADSAVVGANVPCILTPASTSASLHPVSPGVPGSLPVKTITSTGHRRTFSRLVSQSPFASLSG